VAAVAEFVKIRARILTNSATSQNLFHSALVLRGENLEPHPQPTHPRPLLPTPAPLHRRGGEGAERELSSPRHGGTEGGQNFRRAALAARQIQQF